MRGTMCRQAYIHATKDTQGSVSANAAGEFGYEWACEANCVIQAVLSNDIEGPAGQEI